MRYIGNVFRPPSEADSLLLQVTIGCSHNQCDFCAMYREKQFRVRKLEHVLEDIDLAHEHYGDAMRRVFLCDGNALVLSAPVLTAILERLATCFPALQRVGVYANARDILGKSDAELRALHDRRLDVLYLGLESGSDTVLRENHKGATAAEMVAAIQKARECGIKTSVIYLLGLGGRARSQEHALASAAAVSAMNPTYLSALTVTVVPGTPLADRLRAGTFELPEPVEFLQELRLFLQSLDVKATVFRSNHASNYLALAGRLPRDKARLIAEVDDALACGHLRPEHLRGL
jgi:radical SAM superfamily enzyme YgiQ (UPF0313 family)